MTFISYRDSGVDIDAANKTKSHIKELARSTFNSQVLSQIGTFGALFKPDFSGATDPVLVASTDGVGTKLKVAFLTKRYNTVGYDLVAHCVNDILVQGATPLFFMDYIAGGKLEPDVIASLIEGLVVGCSEANCPLIGGETAEMPGFYSEGDYDLAGFILGWVDRHLIIDGSNIEPGDVVLGLPSVGLHTNGYSLARKLFFETAGYNIDTKVAELGCTVAEELLKPHLNYLPYLKNTIKTKKIKGLAHITGGGISENIPRILPENCSVEINYDSWPILPVFAHLKTLGQLSKQESYRVFNMGIGMVVIVASDSVAQVREEISKQNINVYQIGQVIKGNQSVVLK